MSSAIGINWELKYRLKMEKLKKRCEELYNENQKMKRRLDKYELNRQQVLRINKKSA